MGRIHGLGNHDGTGRYSRAVWVAYKPIPDGSCKNDSRPDHGIVFHVDLRLVELTPPYLDHEESCHTERVRQTPLGHNTDDFRANE